MGQLLDFGPKKAVTLVKALNSRALMPLAMFQNGTFWDKITNKLWRQSCVNQIMNYQLINYDLILDLKFPYLTRR